MFGTEVFIPASFHSPIPVFLMSGRKECAYGQRNSETFLIRGHSGLSKRVQPPESIRRHPEHHIALSTAKFVTVPDRPGIGVEMDEEAARSAQIPGTPWFASGEGA